VVRKSSPTSLEKRIFVSPPQWLENPLLAFPTPVPPRGWWSGQTGPGYGFVGASFKARVRQVRQLTGKRCKNAVAANPKSETKRF